MLAVEGLLKGSGDLVSGGKYVLRLKVRIGRVTLLNIALLK